jgi:hypothetical protein
MTSAPFAAGAHGQVAVKVIDDRGNELLVAKGRKEAGKPRGPLVGRNRGRPPR